MDEVSNSETAPRENFRNCSTIFSEILLLLAQWLKNHREPTADAC
jgi:hypothetical protein